LSITLDLSRASNAPAEKALVNLSGLTRDGLRQALIDAGVCPPEKAKMRASQVWGWIHHYGVTDFAAMSNVAKDMQAKLAEHFTLARPEIVERQVSKDGTRKWLIRTAPGIEIETVYIPDVGRAGSRSRRPGSCRSSRRWATARRRCWPSACTPPTIHCATSWCR
jgi:23S rRNA (adenine2503-C2)-methyltransferase